MKPVAWLVTVFVVTAAAPPGGYYATKYDHINVDTILNTRRLVNYYAACLTGKGPCPPQGVEFKRILPEALRTTCARCTEKQRTVALRSIRRLRKEYPKVWAQLSEIWDPTGEYIKKFEDSFSSKPQAETTTLETNLVLDNRFGDSSKVEVAKPTDSKPYPPPTIPVTNTNPPPSTTSTSTSTSTTTSTTTRASTTSKIPELTTKTAYTPLTVTYGVNRFPNPVDLGPKLYKQGQGLLTCLYRLCKRLLGTNNAIC